MSSAPTRDAAVCKTEYPFQSASPLPCTTRAASEASAAPWDRANAPIRPSLEIAAAEPAHRITQCHYLLDRGKIADDRADAIRRARADLCRDHIEGVLPRCRNEPSLLADIRLVEPLGAQPIDNVARL